MRRPAMMRIAGVALVALSTVAFVTLSPFKARMSASTVSAATPGELSTLTAAAEKNTLDVPDVKCASCHKAIYESYEATAMARGSGLARDGLIPGEFRHQPSGVTYKVFARGDEDLVDAMRAVPDSLRSERRLELFVGSGRRGRTYLYEQGGQWFELPINYYTRRQQWAMAPAYDDATRMPDALPVDPGCLHCHASQVALSLPEARNRFAGLPFRQAGIGCATCHGDPTAHLASGGHAAMVNPGKLSVSRRDSACIQCHLEGDAVVYKPGKSLVDFKAGDDLGDFAVYFVHASQASGGARATSQYEALLRSACKRTSGDALTCTSCHDPHSTPSAVERVAYYRSRCLSCHTGPTMAVHHPEQPDCASCHMPSRGTSDITHEQVTDHDIEARPSRVAQHRDEGDTLVPVGAFAASDRELGLAYAQLAERRGNQSNPSYSKRALELLTRAYSAGAKDAEVETRLGLLLQLASQPKEAEDAYRSALRQAPYDPTALTNLAVLAASGHHVDEAIRLLKRLAAADPSQTLAGADLAFIECTIGQPQAALSVLEAFRSVNPDDAILREFERTGLYQGQRCKLR